MNVSYKMHKLLTIYTIIRPKIYARLDVKIIFGQRLNQSKLRIIFYKRGPIKIFCREIRLKFNAIYNKKIMWNIKHFKETYCEIIETYCMHSYVNNF